MTTDEMLKTIDDASEEISRLRTENDRLAAERDEVRKLADLWHSESTKANTAVTRLERENARLAGALEAARVASGVSVQPPWCAALPLQQQSVLLLAARGPDGIARDHPCKPVQIAYRACVFLAGKYGRLLAWGERADTFMSLDRFADDVLWGADVKTFFANEDALPHHYLMHLMHGAQILGYKHPDARFRDRWRAFYWQMVDGLHLMPEDDAEMDDRLGDWNREHWDRAALTAVPMLSLGEPALGTPSVPAAPPLGIDAGRGEPFSDAPLLAAIVEAQSSPWPLREVLSKLAAEVRHALDDHACDHHGWEVAQGAVEAAERMLPADAPGPAPLNVSVCGQPCDGCGAGCTFRKHHEARGHCCELHGGPAPLNRKETP